MSIASELNALNGYILGAYDEINTKGGTVPANKNMANLASAIGSISTGSSTTITPLNVTENGTYTAPTGTAYSPVTVNVSGGGGGLKVESGLFTVSTDTDLNTNSSSIEIASITLTSVYIAGLVLNGTLTAGLRNFASSIHVDPSALGLSASGLGRVSACCRTTSSATNGNINSGGMASSAFSGLYVSGGKLIYNVRASTAQAKFLADRTYTWFVVGE